jgi:hypothetical protein
MSENENESPVVGVPTTSVPSAKERNEGDLNRNVVVVRPEEDIQIVEDEVPQSVIQAKVKEAMAKETKIDYAAELKAMIGNPLSAAQDYLDLLKKNKVISTYKVIPIGMVTTLEMEPGRVTVIIDPQKNIIDIEIS